MKKAAVTAIILARNEAEMLPGCLRTIAWCKEIIVIDDGSSDNTSEIAENAGCKVISFKHQSFARRREEGAKFAAHDWILYIDADERIIPELADEMQRVVSESNNSAFQMNRTNIFFGKVFQYGGWETDTVTRLIDKRKLKGWKGDIHESPIISGTVGTLKTNLLHFSHRTIVGGLYKTAAWTPVEAQLLAKASTTKISFAIIIKKGLGEFWRRAIKYRGYHDGEPGLMESLIQAINRMLVYLQIWELQQTPPIKELYAVKEREVEILWEQHK
ncbi:MAG TPA: glycosyltransferase family 2 protein [Candidatus Woesebacteria bacterium]|jgi:(heptosyl)LPS beta-1,4-glucosyltransferase|nr:glycosyltransferase family 2 protein [Candidatus Woesebacteria bacterium]HNS65240.1 glycosyltransferase family 2 protein [Candidatus Woesebacteria bacterium]